MAKGTTVFLFILTTLASLLVGFNIGRQLYKSDSLSLQSTDSNQSRSNQNQQSAITLAPSPTIILTPIISSSLSATLVPINSGLSVIRDQTCGFAVTFPSSFINQKSENGKSFIITNPNNPSDIIITACQKEIPRPPLPSDKIESILLDGAAATLYHDQNVTDGSPRDEVIIKHPKKDLEIIIAGYGNTFQEALSSFRFIQ